MPPKKNVHFQSGHYRLTEREPQFSTIREQYCLRNRTYTMSYANSGEYNFFTKRWDPWRISTLPWLDTSANGINASH
jgi:hypothetical protein